jgi:hypothetical protein
MGWTCKIVNIEITLFDLAAEAGSSPLKIADLNAALVGCSAATCDWNNPTGVQLKPGWPRMSAFYLQLFRLYHTQLYFLFVFPGLYRIPDKASMPCYDADGVDFFSKGSPGITLMTQGVTHRNYQPWVAWNQPINKNQVRYSREIMHT